MSKTIEDLIGAINDTTSTYEDEYVKYVNIHFDKKALSELLYELKYLQENEEWPERQEFLKKILDKHDPNYLFNLLVNEPNVDRSATLERWSRRAAMEVITFGKYDIDTLNVISKFPMEDYQLVIKRINEIIYIYNDVTKQSVMNISGLAGND